MLIASTESNRYQPVQGPQQKKKPAKAEADPTKSDQFTPAQQEELDGWNNRLRSKLGELQTPPAGATKAQQEKAKGYIEDMVDRLAGADLTARNLELRVEVFSGDVPQAALDDDMSREAAWKEDHPNEPWPVRGWMGIPADSTKPIYRLTVDLGLLSTLKTEDELAFVLAQQTERLLDHDKRDPKNEEELAPANKNFIDSREWQAAADKAAIARMNNAGFNPRGAYHALNKLYATNPIDYPDDDLNRGLVAAAHGHEHEGMRLGLVQAEVESYVRRGEAATAKEETPLPTELTIPSPAGYVKAVKNPEEFQRDFQSLALKLAGDTTPAWMFGNDVPPLELGKIKLAGGTPEDKELALLKATEALNQSSNTPQQKVDGFLRLLVALRFEALPEEPFSEGTESSINSFLKTNSADWNASKFVDSLVSGDDSLQRPFISSVVFNENFQHMAADALPGLEGPLPKAWTRDAEKKENPEQIKDFIENNHEKNHNSWPLAGRLDRAALDYVAQVDGPSLAAETSRGGANRAMVMSNDLLGMTTPSGEFLMKLRDASQGLLDASSAKREDQARLRMRPPIQQPKELYDYLTELGHSETYREFTPEFNEQLPKMLKDVAQVTTSQPGMLYSNERQEALSENFERRVVDDLKSAAPEEKRSLLNFLSRHIPHEQRVRGASPRRAWLGEAVKELSQAPIADVIAQIASPDLSQHSELISKSLTDTYHLKPEDLPDTTTGSLRALNERVKNGEFEPKRENYQSDAAFEQAQDQYFQSQGEMNSNFVLVAPLESRLVLGKMALLGHDTEVSTEVAKKLDVESFKQVLVGAEQAKERAEILTEISGNKDTEHVGSDAGAFLMDGFLAVQSKVEDLATWYDLANRSIDFSHGGMEARVGTKRALASNLYGKLDKLEGKELREWMGKEKVLDLLSADQTSQLLVKLVGDQAAPGADLAVLAETVKKLDADFKLNEEHPLAYLEMRDKLTENAKLQPSNVDSVFPAIQRGVTDTTEAYKKQARALSGVLAIAREHSPQEQIDTIEYLMGRQDVMPAYLEKAAEAQSFAPLSESLQTTRQELLDADNQTRVMVANSFLAGPSGIMRTEEGKTTLINHFLKNLQPKNRELGEKIANAVIFSQGEADTLAAAFILGQTPEEPKEGEDPGKAKKLDEATILNRLFDSYGVPGIKMKQYLAFTAEFKDFREAFESAQDASNPLNYYQVLKLVQNRFGDDWPKDLTIDRVLGSGSVNVAIRYRDEKTGKREVVSLGRQDIQESTAYDFDRFNKFIEELTRTPEDRERFGFVLGLLKLTQDSVNLEFTKEKAMAVQQMAYKTYHHVEDGWNIRSIDAYKVENLGLFMEEAKGKTARKIFTRDKELYRSAMGAMAKVEFAVLKGQGADYNWNPKPLFANPDFHDGQVLIDEETKSVTILDFGQAVPIDNKDREAGIDLLTVIGKGDSPKAAAKRLNKRYFNKQKVIQPEDMAKVMKRIDRMDCFVHLLSTLSLKGADVPLSTIHWVLSINRQLHLGEKINKPIDQQIKAMVINHKVGLPLVTYNAAHGTSDAAIRFGKATAKVAVDVAKSIAHTVGGWFGWETDDIFQSEKPDPNRKVEAEYHGWKPNFDLNRPVTTDDLAPGQVAPKI